MNVKIKILFDDKEVWDMRAVLDILNIGKDKMFELLRYDAFIKPVKYKNRNYWYKDEVEEYVRKSKKNAR